MDLALLNFNAVSLREAISADLHSQADRRVCDEYFVPFGKKAEELEADGNVFLSNAYQFLGAICSLRLKPDDPHRPLVPFMISEIGRTPILDEVTDAQLDVVAQVAPDVNDGELRARLADLVWVRRKDHRLARIAINGYCVSADVLLSTVLKSDAVERFERALQIAAFLGVDGESFRDTRSKLETVAFRVETEHHVVGRCLEVLLRFPSDRPSDVADLSTARAKGDDVSDKILWQRRFWELGAKWYERAKDDEAARTARIESAKTFELEADRALRGTSAPSVLVGAHFLEQAIQAYRRIEGTEAERETLHRRLLECQKSAIREIPTLESDPVDLTDVAKQSRDAVRGMAPTEALRRFAFACQIPVKSKLRSDAESSIAEHPLAFLFGATTLSSTGKVVAKHGTASSGSDADRESLILHQMYSQATTQHSLYVTGVIEPIRRQIIADHYVRYEDFLPIVSYNTVIPPGREQLFLLGLHAGLYGNLVEALHILIPQLEHMIREMLASSGFITSGLNAEGIQMERDLNSLLYESKLDELLGENLVFELRGLLVEQASANLRNRLAHGMLEMAAFHSDVALYIWWLILRICCLGTLHQQDETASDDDN